MGESTADVDVAMLVHSSQLEVPKLEPICTLYRRRWDSPEAFGILRTLETLEALRILRTLETLEALGILGTFSIFGFVSWPSSGRSNLKVQHWAWYV